MPWGISIPYHPRAPHDARSLEQGIQSIRNKYAYDTESTSEDASLVFVTVDEEWELVPGVDQTDFDVMLTSSSASETKLTKTGRSHLNKSERPATRNPTSDPEKADMIVHQASMSHEQSQNRRACERQCQVRFRQRPRGGRNENPDASIFSQCLLLEAIRAKDENSAASLLADGVDSNSTDMWGPAITQALRTGSKTLTRLLLAKGADPNAKDVWGPVLTQAIRAADGDLASKLLQKGSCPNARDTWGPALTQAIRAKDGKLAIELLQTGADPNAEDTWGPALTQAVRARNQQLAVMLVEYGADPRAKDTWGPALSQSVRYHTQALTKVLLGAGAIEC